MIVSFLTPSYNYGPLISDCIDSVSKQSGALAVEHVIVDDGSTDDSVALIEEAAADVILEIQANAGQGAALNRALSRSSGEWVSWLPADDFLLPWTVDLVAPHLRGPADVVFGDVVFADIDGRLLRLYAHHSISDVALSAQPTLSPPGTFVRASAFGAVGWDYSLRQLLDWDLWLRLHRSGAQFLYVPEPLAVFRRHKYQTSQDLRACDRWEWAEIARRYDLSYDWRHRLLGRADRIVRKFVSGAYARQLRTIQACGADLRWFTCDGPRADLANVLLSRGSWR